MQAQLGLVTSSLSVPDIRSIHFILYQSGGRKWTRNVLLPGKSGPGPDRNVGDISAE